MISVSPKSGVEDRSCGRFGGGANLQEVRLGVSGIGLHGVSPGAAL